MATRFLERLREEVVLGDGAMGSYLHAQGVPLDARFEALNLSNPALVRRVHSDYIAAGARFIETNTFGANRNKLAAGQLGDQTRVMNLAGVRIAREVAPADVYVFGSVGPLGKSNLGDEYDKEGVFREQIVALAEGGVDGFILETFTDLDELLTALRVAKNASDLPVIAQMAFYARGKTASGVDAPRVVRELEAHGADVIGGNCGPSGPLELSKVVKAMTQLTTEPVSAFPNASYPRYVDGRFIYANNADYFAQLVLDLVDSGANLVGGCCGTTPEHIFTMAQRLGERRAPATRVLLPPERREPAPAAVRRKRIRLEVVAPPNFLQSNAHPVNIIVEVDPPRGLNVQKAIRVSATLRELGANAVSIAENQLASIRMSSFALSHLIQQETGITAICHCTCRDRNLLGQQSELMGAAVLGIRHILAITGDPISLDGTGGSSVFDTNAFGLIELIARLNRGENLRGESIAHATEFVIGAGVSPNRARMEGEIRRLEKKAALGATFAMTQPPASREMIFEMREKTRHIPIETFVGILPLVSHRNAEFLHNEVPGIRLADDVRERMRLAADPLREGIAIAQEYIEATLEAGFKGVYIIPMLGKYEMAYELVRYIRERHG